MTDPHLAAAERWAREWAMVAHLDPYAAPLAPLMNNYDRMQRDNMVLTDENQRLRHVLEMGADALKRMEKSVDQMEPSIAALKETVTPK